MMGNEVQVYLTRNSASAHLRDIRHDSAKKQMNAMMEGMKVWDGKSVRSWRL